MISARADIANGTKESIVEWGFPVRIVYAVSASGAFIDVIANGRKSSQEMTAEGLPIVSNKPYVSIPIEDLDIIPKKGDFIRTPKDFFRPEDGQTVWHRIEEVPIHDGDWFVKIYMTNTEQKPPGV